MRREEKTDIAWDFIIWLIIIGVVLKLIGSQITDPVENAIRSVEWTILIGVFFIIKAIQRGPQ